MLGVVLSALAAQADTVRGRVHDRERPLAAQVRMLGPPGNDGGWVECAPDVPTFRDNLERRGPWVLGETFTNDAGEFDLEYGPQPHCAMEIAAAGYRRSTWHSPAPPRPGVLRMGYIVDEPVETVAVVLRGADGGPPIAGARLRWRSGGTGPVETRTTDERGRVTLEAVRCLLAEAPGFEPAVLSSKRLSTPRSPPLELALLPARRVLARVWLDGGLADARVEVTTGRGSKTMATDGGVLAVDDVSPPFTLKARAGGRLAVAEVTAQSPGQLDLDLRPAAKLKLLASFEDNQSLRVSVGNLSRTLFAFLQTGTEFELLQGTYLVRSYHRGNRGRAPINVARWVILDRDLEVPADEWPLPLTGSVVTHGGEATEAELSVQGDLELRCGMGMGLCTPLQRFFEGGRTDDGGFTLWVPEAGEYRLTAWLPDGGASAKAVVQVPGPPARLELTHAPYAPERYPRWFITGTVRDEKGRPVDLPVCATLGNGGGCSTPSDGGFALDVSVPGVQHRVHVSERRRGLAWYSDPVMARAGDTVELVAKRWRPRSTRVVDPDGKPLALPKWQGKGARLDLQSPGRNTLRLDGYVPLAFDTETVGPELKLARLPLRGTVADAAGHPAEGAAVSLLCESVTNERVVRWSRYTSDVGGGTTWTHWPDGVQCVAATARVDAAGRFEIPDVGVPVRQVEVRSGTRVSRTPYTYGQPLELVLP